MRRLHLARRDCSTGEPFVREEIVRPSLHTRTAHWVGRHTAETSETQHTHNMSCTARRPCEWRADRNRQSEGRRLRTFSGLEVSSTSNVEPGDIGSPTCRRPRIIHWHIPSHIPCAGFLLDGEHGECGSRNSFIASQVARTPTEPFFAAPFRAFSSPFARAASAFLLAAAAFASCDTPQVKQQQRRLRS